MTKEPITSLPPSIDASIAIRHRELLRTFEAALEHEALAKAVLLAALQRKSDGVVLIDGAGAIICLNDTARTLLGAGDGLSFASGTFQTGRLPETKRLQACIVCACERPDPAATKRVLVTRPSGRAPYVVSVTPIVQNGAAQPGRCIVHIVDLAAQVTISKEAASETFGLSDREADLAVELTRTSSLREAAEKARMALNTARNHMQSIFSKCRVHSQLELSRLLTRLG
jgi:DNA-binding CsgD family transcriptional regulator